MNHHPPHAIRDFLAWLFFKISGWKIDGEIPKQKRYVAIFAHHTSNWDFIVLLMCKFQLRILARWYAKASIFWWPQGPLMRMLGGIPIERSQSHNVVDVAIQAFEKNEYFILALAPEGTRKKVDKFKSGFYYIAKGAQVPIIPVGLDFPSKTVKVLEPVHTTEDFEADMERIYAAFRGIQAAKPQFVCDRCLPGE